MSMFLIRLSLSEPLVVKGVVKFRTGFLSNGSYKAGVMLGVISDGVLDAKLASKSLNGFLQTCSKIGVVRSLSDRRLPSKSFCFSVC